MAQEKGVLKGSMFDDAGVPIWQQQGNSDAGADEAKRQGRWLAVHPLEVPRWRTLHMLQDLPAVRYFLNQLTPLHQLLMRRNWLYIVLIVYLSLLTKLFNTFASLPVISTVSGFADDWISKGVLALLDRYPFLGAEFAPEGGVLGVVSRLLDPRRVQYVPFQALILSAQYLIQLVKLLALLASTAFGVVATAVIYLEHMLNDDRSFSAVQYTDLPPLLAGRVLGFFWRTPFNIANYFVFDPFIVQPTDALCWVVEKLDYVCTGAYKEQNREPALAQNQKQNQKQKNQQTPPQNQNQQAAPPQNQPNPFEGPAASRSADLPEGH